MKKGVFVLMVLCVIQAHAQVAGNALLYSYEIDEIARSNSLPTTATDNVTIEAWFKWAGANFLTSDQIIIYNGRAGTDGYGIYLDVANSYKISLEINNSRYYSGTTPVQGWWYHVAAVRSGGNWKLYINGSQSSIATSTAPNTPSTSFSIGASHSLIRGLNGVIDEIRVSNIARYTSSFPAPSAPFTSDANTVLLYHCDESSGQVLVDSSPAGNNGYLGSSTDPDMEDPGRTTSDAPLPVLLFDFMAKYREGKVRLSWSTSPVTETETLEIQRSVDGLEWQRFCLLTVEPGNEDPVLTVTDPLTDLPDHVEQVHYRILFINLEGQTEFSPIQTVSLRQPQQYSLMQNHPNPFNPVTQIQYTLSEPTLVRLVVYNTVGQQIRELVNAYQYAGEYTIPFSAESLPGGIYFYKLSTDKGFVDVKRMVLLK